MIPSAFENVKRLPDDQLARVVQAARQGDMTAIEALNLTSATPVLAEMMRRNRMREMMQKNMMGGAPDPKTVLDKQLAQAQATQGIGDLEIPGRMEEQTYAHGGIVSFSGGEEVEGSDIQPQVEDFVSPAYDGLRMTKTPEMYGDIPSAAPQGDGIRELSAEEIAKMTPRQREMYLKQLTTRRYEEARAALGKPPTDMTPEEQREEYEKNLALARQTSAPYLKQMQELLAQAKPDQAKIEQDATKRAINMGLLSLIGAKRMPGESRMSSFASNVGEALRTGAGAYEKGVGGIDRLKREYLDSQLKFVEAQNAAARGDAAVARDLAKQASDQRRDAVRIYNSDNRTLTNAQKAELDSITRQTVAEIQAEQRARDAEVRERIAQNRDKIILQAAGIRAGGSGGSRPITEGQAVAAIQREVKRIMDSGEGDDLSDEEIIAKARARVRSMINKPDGKGASTSAPTPPGTIVLDPSGKATPK